MLDDKQHILKIGMIFGIKTEDDDQKQRQLLQLCFIFWAIFKHMWKELPTL